MEVLEAKLQSITNDFFEKLSAHFTNLARDIPLACSRRLREVGLRMHTLQESMERNSKRQQQIEAVI